MKESCGCIEEYCQKKSKEITRILIETYHSVDFEIDSDKIEREIYDIALSYAKIFFFEKQSVFLEEARNQAISIIQVRFDVKDKKVEKMSDVDLLAHLLKLAVIDQLSEQDIILI